ncbi:NTP transferase domain-containing protein [Parendozoicomonas sp. Alg238-R29]|uniref:NTP transferase domain-containing protein n=1 Tax=Parendozoicomonas sp. Alg238-R29 TaxID=2993446 RepID=UPI00248E5163|nr:NTP transferase domain-containing protein [Parendozoicomonas sp. Alg238-R29]
MNRHSKTSKNTACTEQQAFGKQDINEPTSEYSQPVDCVVLAAGLSSRMGEWKLQLPLGDQSQGLRTILDRSLTHALSFCHRVILVTGHRSDELFERYHSRDNIHLVFNPDYRQGLTSSVLTGLAHVSSDFAFITHGDLPFLNRKNFSTLWSARHDAARNKCAVFPICNGQSGHPVLITDSMIPALLNADHNRPMKQLLKHCCIHIPVSSPEIYRDIDTPEAYLAETGISLGVQQYRWAYNNDST